MSHTVGKDSNELSLQSYVRAKSSSRKCRSSPQGWSKREVEAGEIFTETRGTQICEFLLLASWCWHQSIGGGWGGFSHGKALVGCP